MGWWKKDATLEQEYYVEYRTAYAHSQQYTTDDTQYTCY